MLESAEKLLSKVPLCNNTISDDLNDHLLEKSGWLCPVSFHDLRKCSAINKLIIPLIITIS
jgi:hypothetical protein